MSDEPGFGPPAVGGGTFGDSIFVVDQSRCIGCRACVQACEECGTHRGRSMIHLDDVDGGPAGTRQTAPTVCMHGTKSPSSPSTSTAARPMRVMIFMLTAT